VPTKTTKTKPIARQAEGEPINSLIDREQDLRAVKLAAFERLKDRLVEEIEDLERATLFMSSRDVAVFEEFGITRQDGISMALRVHQGIAEIREEAGDPAVIESARQEHAAAVEAEQSTRADAEELDNVADGEPMPVLARQIRALQQRLGEVTATRVAAEEKLRRLEGRREWLRNHAPEAMRSDIGKELSRRQLTSPTWRRLGELKLQIFEFGKVVEQSNISLYDKCLVLCVHAQHYCPEAYSSGNGSPSIEIGRFRMHVDQLERETIPALKAEQAEMHSKWDAVVAGVEAALDHWIKTGEVLSD